MSDIFLELKNVKKHFGGIKALDGVDLTVRQGEIHCLAGENGCGKSTLIKVVSGVHDVTSGEVYIEGTLEQKLTPRESIHKGIQFIYQDFAVFPNLSVAENIGMNQNLMTDAKIMDWKKARELAVGAMEQIGAKMNPDTLVESLSVANKQMVAICRAIINDAKLLILDEPTTALTASEVEKLNHIIRKLKENGMAILIVNHKLDEIYEIADRLTILRNGKNAATGSISEFDRTRFIMAMTGREFNEAYYRPDSQEEEILRIEHYTRKNEFEDVSITLNKGDILGITGLLGSGRSEIGESLFGLRPADSGKLYLNGEQITVQSIDDAIGHQIAYVPEDRLTQGLFLTRSIQDNTVVASIKKYFHKGRLDAKEMRQATVDWIEKIGCVAPSPEAKIRTLSGGNAQKIVIAKWLNTNPKLLVLNGPTVGVDVGAKSDIHAILRNLAKEGMGIIVISDDLSEIIQNCNKVVIMRNGRASGMFDTKELNETKLAKSLSGAEGDYDE